MFSFPGVSKHLARIQMHSAVGSPKTWQASDKGWCGGIKNQTVLQPKLIVFQNKCLETPYGSLYWALRERGCQMLLNGRNMKGWRQISDSFFPWQHDLLQSGEDSLPEKRSGSMQVFQRRRRRLLREQKSVCKANWCGSTELHGANLFLNSPAQAWPAVCASCRLAQWEETCKIAVFPFKEGKKRGWEAFLLKLQDTVPQPSWLLPYLGRRWLSKREEHSGSKEGS